MTRVVDAHVHIVSGDASRYPLRPSGVGSDWYVTSPVDLGGLQAALTSAGVDDAVLVQAYGAYSTDNAYVLDAASAAGLPAVVVAESSDALRTLVTERGARGVRLFAIGGGGSVDDVGQWAVAVELGVPVVVATLPDGLPALARMLDRFPDAVVALDHCGFVDPRAGAEPLLALAEFANLHLKVTSLVLSRPGDPRDVVDALASTFGADRLLWGSDFPQTHDRSYADLVALGRHASSRLDATAQAAFLGGTARRLWPAR